MNPPTPPSDPSGPTVASDADTARPNVRPAPSEPEAAPTPHLPGPTPAPDPPAPVTPAPVASEPTATRAIPDHDPFTDTDVYPGLGQRPSTGGFAGLSRTTGQQAGGDPAHRSAIGHHTSAASTAIWPAQPPATPTGSTGVNAPSVGAPPPPVWANGSGSAPSGFGPTDSGEVPGAARAGLSPAASNPAGAGSHPGSTPPIGSTPVFAPPPGASNPFPQTPPTAPSAFNPTSGSSSDPAWSPTAARPGPAAWTGGGGAHPPAGPAPVGESRQPSRRTFGRGPLVTIGALAAVLLLGLGALGGALLSNQANGSGGNDVALPVDVTDPSTATTRRDSSQQTGRTTTAPPRSAPAPSTTTPATLSTAPGTAPTTTASSSADPSTLVADFRWSPDPVPAGQSITITDASTGNPTRWVWTWNGNVVSSSQPKGFTTSLREDTPITLTVCRGNGSSNCASVTKMVTVD